MDILDEIYKLSNNDLCEIGNKLSMGDIEGYDNTTVNEYIKVLLKEKKCKKNVKEYKDNGVYLFEITITTKENNLLPIYYGLCYIVIDENKYVITNYSKDTKIYNIKEDINKLLTSPTTENLSKLFRPDYKEQHLFENLIEINSVECDYYN